MIENKVTFKLMTRKIFETWLVALLLGLATFTGCNSLEITMPIGPKGEQGAPGKDGADGLSAYDLWVKAVKEGEIKDWNGGTELADFFIYLKGRDGKDGADGK